MILTQTKMWEIEARLREAKAAAIAAQATADGAVAGLGDTLPVQAGHGGEFLTTDGAATSWGTPDHDTLTNTHNLTTDISHGTISGGHNLTTDIDHDSLTNTHNLTTDIDHDALTNFAASEHYAQTAITNVSTGLATGLLKVTTGTGALSVGVAGTDFIAPSAHVFKVKTADTTIISDASHNVDPHLTGIPLEASSYYSMFGCLVINTADAANYVLRLVGNQNYTAMATYAIGTINTVAKSVTAGTTLDFGAINVGTGDRIQNFSGFLYTDTAVTIDVEWAQQVSTASNTTLLKGSFWSFHKLA